MALRSAFTVLHRNDMTQELQKQKLENALYSSKNGKTWNSLKKGVIFSVLPLLQRVKNGTLPTYT